MIRPIEMLKRDHKVFPKLFHKTREGKFQLGCLNFESHRVYISNGEILLK